MAEPTPIADAAAGQHAVRSKFHQLADEAAFRRILRVVAEYFETPTAYISIIQDDRQTRYCDFGVTISAPHAPNSFIAPILEAQAPLVVLDATRDPRFAHNGFVTGHPHVRFFAGIPLVAGDAVLGALCIIDYVPRLQFGEAELRKLADFAQVILEKLALDRLAVERLTIQSRFDAIAATSPDGIICADEDGRITFWNDAAAGIFGYSSAEAVGQNISIIVPAAQRVRNGRSLDGVVEGGARALVGRTVELMAEAKSGAATPIELSMSMWMEDGLRAFGAIVRDIGERKATQDRLFRLAHFDTLTGLPNRYALNRDLAAAIEGEVPFGLLLLDLDRFKEINDTLGHAAGDAVLKAIAARLVAALDGVGAVHRLGGDEFAILLRNGSDPIDTAIVAKQLIREVKGPLVLDVQTLRVGASIGIALYPHDGMQPGQLLSCADMALHEAKHAGRRRHRFFTAALRTEIVRERTLREDLHHACLQEHFLVFYQPQIRLDDGALVGAEALIRWQRQDKGILPPSAFLPTLERSEDAARVGDWVLRSACAEARRWRASGFPAFRVAVNLFEEQLRERDLAATVMDALAHADLPPDALDLEITENIMLSDGIAEGALRALRDAGVGIALDDFGTGYASLSLLKRLPLSKLKIDQSFVRRMCDDAEDAAIVDMVLTLGRSFGFDVVAEGVETSRQRDHLAAQGCREAQGYLFGRPMTATDLHHRFGTAAGNGDSAGRNGTSGRSAGR